MASYEKDKRVRLPSVSAKIYEITGMSRSEHGLLRRVANLIDALVVQRDISNSGESQARTLSERVPVPQKVIATPIIGGIEVKWDPVDYDRFDSYEVQHDSTSTFANTVSTPSFSNRLVITGLTQTTFIRVRTLSRTGEASRFASPFAGGVSVPTTVFEVDTDFIDPENRTRINPIPTLLGRTFEAQAGNKAFLGVGAAVGPGPISFIDPSGSEVPKNQITYTVLDTGTVAQSQTMNLPTSFYGFYNPVQVPRFSTPSGSFLDFFDIEALDFDPTVLDVIFLGYLQTPHEQTGTINQASMSVIKF